MTQSGHRFSYWKFRIDSKKLNDWIQAIGIFAVVASLIFVGIQMRQSQEIAIAETFLSIMSSEMEIYNATIEHAELWEKANNGEDLTGAETLIFESLVASIDRRADRSRSQLNRLGHIFAARAQTADLASFLYQNPAARRVWVSQWKTRTAHRTATDSYVQRFPQQVNAHLEMLDRMDQ
jgi:hypothetical protein